MKKFSTLRSQRIMRATKAFAAPSRRGLGESLLRKLKVFEDIFCVTLFVWAAVWTMSAAHLFVGSKLLIVGSKFSV